MCAARARQYYKPLVLGTLWWCTGLALLIGLAVLASGAACVTGIILFAATLLLSACTAIPRWEETFTWPHRCCYVAWSSCAPAAAIALVIGSADFGSCYRANGSSLAGFAVASTVWLLVTAVALTAFNVLLVVLWSLGAACCRGKPNPAAGKTSESDPLHVDLFPEAAFARGRLGMTVLPGRRRKESFRSLPADLERLKQHYSCDTLITLVEDSELQLMGTVSCCRACCRHELNKRFFMPIAGIADFSEQCTHAGIDCVRLLTRDKWIFNSMAAFRGLVATILDRMAKGQTVIVHCNGGKVGPCC
jgi:hypothetical protein